MSVRRIAYAVVLMLGATCLACGSSEAESDTVAISRLEAVIPPCIPYVRANVDPCATRDDFPTFTPYIELAYEIPEIVKSLEQIFREWSDRPYRAPHFVVRATTIPGSTRCGTAVPSTFHHQAYLPGYANIERYDSFCYLDLAVNEYLIGQGPARLTVTTGENPHLSRSDNDSICNQSCRHAGARDRRAAGIEGVEWILFLGGPRNLGQGAWHIHGSSDVQRDRDGGVVVVRRRKGVILAHSKPEHYAINLSRLVQPLDEFKNTVADAYAIFLELTGGRTGTLNDKEGRPPPKLASNAGPAGFNDFMIRTRLIEGTPAPPPPIPGENDPNPAGLTVNDIIATRVAGGVRIPGGLEGTATPVSALGDEPTATAAGPTAIMAVEPTTTPKPEPVARDQP